MNCFIRKGRQYPRKACYEYFTSLTSRGSGLIDPLFSTSPPSKKVDCCFLEIWEAGYFPPTRRDLGRQGCCFACVRWWSNCRLGLWSCHIDHCGELWQGLTYYNQWCGKLITHPNKHHSWGGGMGDQFCSVERRRCGIPGPPDLSCWIWRVAPTAIHKHLCHGTLHGQSNRGAPPRSSSCLLWKFPRRISP